MSVQSATRPSTTGFIDPLASWTDSLMAAFPIEANPSDCEVNSGKVPVRTHSTNCARSGRYSTVGITCVGALDPATPIFVYPDPQSIITGSAACFSIYEENFF